MPDSRFVVKEALTINTSRQLDTAPNHSSINHNIINETMILRTVKLSRSVESQRFLNIECESTLFYDIIYNLKKYVRASQRNQTGIRLFCYLYI